MGILNLSRYNFSLIYYRLSFLDEFNLYANEIGLENTVEYLLPIFTKIVIKTLNILLLRLLNQKRLKLNF